MNHITVESNDRDLRRHEQADSRWAADRSRPSWVCPFCGMIFRGCDVELHERVCHKRPRRNEEEAGNVREV